ncbi:MAG: immunoglobulin domain-containing protein [Verrucomicrobiota bacterium]
MKTNTRTSVGLLAAIFLVGALGARAALLAYEPFTNAVGATIIGSGGGFGFNGAWQANSSSGVATNTGFGLSYTDPASNTLVTAGGAGFFQGLTSANSDMKPIRLFAGGRGTNGTDGVTTWISFIIARQGPTGTLPGNPYGRGANLPHDIDSGAIQKLAIGNSSNAGSNTVGLIPTGSGANLKGATNTFGGATNFVVVRIDHVTGAANDRAYLFVNPTLGVEPSTNSAGAVSTNAFDFSFDRVRIFAGGQSSATQPYVELIVDEYRLGETFADVAPSVSNSPSVVPGPLLITNAFLTTGGLVLSGHGGSNSAPYIVLAATNISASLTNWLPVATNTFDAAGNFIATNPTAPGASQQFFRLRSGHLPSAPLVPPTITAEPTNQTANAGQNITLVSAATGSAPLRYQWSFNSVAVSAATNATLTLSNVQLTNAGNYSVVVTNNAGSDTSDVATLIVNAPPTITMQPTNVTVIASNNATFTVTASGSPPLRYQWYFNTNTVLANATNASYLITSAQTSNAGTYSVIVTNVFGVVTSSIATLTVTTNPVLLAGAYFVSPSGNDANPGTVASPFLTVLKGLNTINTSGTVYLRGGTYAQPTKLSLTRTGITNGAIRVWAYPDETPVVNSSGNSSDGIAISGRYYHLKGITVTLAGHNGINISGHSNLVEHCIVRENGNTGLHITGGSSGSTFPSYNLILNCDAFLNYDAPDGQDADGFSAKWNLGPGNEFRGCRAWWNSDDGWDLWMGTSVVVLDQCWAFYNGTNYWNNPAFTGNGNGFKLGGNYVGAPHRLVRSVAFRNEAHGVDQNNNTAGLIIDNNTGWVNAAKNFNLNHNTTNAPILGNHVVRNNLSIAGGSGDSFWPGTLLTNNSWQVISAPAANASDVLSTIESVATAPRNADGSLPYWPFLRPVPGGRLIDQGVILTEPYTGTSPDLGAFEDGL